MKNGQWIRAGASSCSLALEGSEAKAKAQQKKNFSGRAQKLVKALGGDADYLRFLCLEGPAASVSLFEEVTVAVATKTSPVGA